MLFLLKRLHLTTCTGLEKEVTLMNLRDITKQQYSYEYDVKYNSYNQCDDYDCVHKYDWWYKRKFAIG
jgi:hypothetical protein